jgi:hypothetical protein
MLAATGTHYLKQLETMSDLTKKLILGKLKTNLPSNEVVELLKIFNTL